MTQQQNHRPYNFTSLNDAILQLPRLSVYALWGYIVLIARVVASRPFQLLAALTASLVSYGVVTLHISHNEFHCRTSSSHPFLSGAAACCSHYFMSSISHFLIYWWVYFVLTNSSILAQSENNAADRQISMIIVITNHKGCFQTVLLNPA